MYRNDFHSIKYTHAISNELYAFITCPQAVAITCSIETSKFPHLILPISKCAKWAIPMDDICLGAKMFLSGGKNCSKFSILLDIFNCLGGNLKALVLLDLGCKTQYISVYHLSFQDLVIHWGVWLLNGIAQSALLPIDNMVPPNEPVHQRVMHLSISSPWGVWELWWVLAEGLVREWIKFGPFPYQTLS